MPHKTFIYTNPAGLRHDTGEGHPESIARLEAVLDLLQAPPFNTLPLINADMAERETLARAHSYAYINAVEDAAPDEDGLAHLDPDTVMSGATLAAALQAAGAVCQAVDDIAAGRCARAFCAVRPPGHHALPERPMGFCLFNNVFVGARHAQEKHGLRRVALVDFDVHHGNGTDFMARAAADILFVSSHHFPFWPGTGDPRYDIPGRVLNVPLSRGADGAVFRAAYEASVFPAIDAFAPDLLMISAGFDAHRDDPLGGLALTEEDYYWVTEKLGALADKHASGRIVSVLEGGYSLTALKSSAGSHVRALAGWPR